MKLDNEREYKLNDSIWLGELPDDWDFKRLKYVSKVKPSNVDKKSDEDELPVLLCNYNEVYKNDFIDSSLDFMEATASPDEIEKFQIEKDDVIITKDSETPEEIALPAYVIENFVNTLCGYHLTLIRSDKAKVIGSYLFRLFQSKQFNTQFVVAANGITRFGLDTYSIKNAIVALPPLEEQQFIAKFLDYKTTQIDTLIEKKEQLLKHLEEKRIALITNAVTGRIPSLREGTEGWASSGIPWLGNIPQHWEVKRLKFVSEIQFSGVDKKTKEDEIEIFLCNYIDVYKNDYIDESINFMQASASENEIKKFLLKEGDVLATKDSETPYEIALPAYVKRDFDNVICGYHLAQIRANKTEIIGTFLFRLFQAKNFNSQFIIQANGITRFGLGVDAIASSWVPIPPLPEQKLIVEYLDKELTKIEQLSEKVTTAIEKLKEYRTSLITSAVTGKIRVPMGDLRNWQPSLPLPLGEGWGEGSGEN